MKEFSTFQRAFLLLLIYNFLGVTKFTTAHLLYTLHSDLESVEKLAVDYANGRQGFVLKHTLATKPTNKVCQLPLELKITMCWKYLTYEEYKFKFTFNMDDSDLSTTCGDKNIFLRILDKSELRIPEISMFRCPFIAEAPFVKKAFTFYVSDSHLDPIAAIVYIQEFPHSAIHPHVYLDSLKLEGLKASQPLLYMTNPPPLSGKNEINNFYKVNRPEIDLDEEKTEVVEKLIEKIKIRDPYSKFQAFYESIDLCGLSTTQKLFLCRETMLSYDFDKNNVDINEWTEQGCRNYELNLNNEKHQLTSFQCPAAIEFEEATNRWWERTYNPATYFLLKNLFSSRLSILKLSKNVMQIESQLKNVDIRLLDTVKKTERSTELTKHVESDLQPTPDYDGEKSSKYELAFPIIVNRKMAEQNAMKFAEITKMKLPYDKFEKTWNIKNVCGLPKKDLFKLCQKVFTNQALWYTIEGEYEDLQCKREMISLVTSEVIPREPREDAFALSLFSCPTVLEKPFPIGLYLSSSPLPDSLLAYDQSYDYKNINPVTTAGPGIFDGQDEQVGLSISNTIFSTAEKLGYK